MKPVLVVDAKATEHIQHRHGIENMKHIDVAHLWLQDEVTSNTSRFRCVKSENNLADIIGKHAISRYAGVQANLRSRDVMVLSAQQKTSSSGNEGSRIRHLVVRFHTCGL